MSSRTALARPGSSMPACAASMSSASSSPVKVAGLAARRRSRSRQAFTTIRCSQVVTAESPRKSPPERGQHPVLERVGGLLRVAERAQRDRPQPVPVPPEQLTEGFRVTRYVLPEQLGVRRLSRGG
jgi:hypothetical protein